MNIYTIISLIFLIAMVAVFAPNLRQERQSGLKDTAQTDEHSDRQAFARYSLKTDTTKRNIDLDLVLSGGPGKDGIPAITNPTFIPIAETDIQDDARGILVNLHGTRRFYPYNILVWHEIVNDRIGETSFAVTFCPLCDSGIVFNRQVGGKVLQFGVSGLLYESNLLMYDSLTESLWSQTRREAVAGAYTDTTLNILPLQVLTLREVRDKYPDTAVMSTDTGHRRDYDRMPYDGYGGIEETLFPFSGSDSRFLAKEPLYVIPFRGHSVAFPFRDFSPGTQTFTVKGEEIVISRDGDEITAMSGEKTLPGYFEFWFSWTTHHQDDGIVLEVT